MRTLKLIVILAGAVEGREASVHVAAATKERGTKVTRLEFKLEAGVWKLEPFAGEGVFGVLRSRGASGRLERGLREELY